MTAFLFSAEVLVFVPPSSLLQPLQNKQLGPCSWWSPWQRRIGKKLLATFFKVCLCEGPAALEPRALELATAPADECLFHLARQEMQMCHFWHPPLPSPLSSKSRSYYRTTQFSSSRKPAFPTVRRRYKSGQWIAFHLFWRPFVSFVKIHFNELTDKKQILNQDLYILVF